LQNGELRHGQVKLQAHSRADEDIYCHSMATGWNFWRYMSSYRVITAHNNLSRQSIYKRRNAHRTQCAGAFGALSTYSST